MSNNIPTDFLTKAHVQGLGFLWFRVIRFQGLGQAHVQGLGFFRVQVKVPHFRVQRSHLQGLGFLGIQVKVPHFRVQQAHVQGLGFLRFTVIRLQGLEQAHVQGLGFQGLRSSGFRVQGSLMFRVQIFQGLGEGSSFQGLAVSPFGFRSFRYLGEGSSFQGLAVSCLGFRFFKVYGHPILGFSGLMFRVQVEGLAD